MSEQSTCANMRDEEEIRKQATRIVESEMLRIGFAYVDGNWHFENDSGPHIGMGHSPFGHLVARLANFLQSQLPEERNKIAPTDVEALSAKFHEIYMQEARRQGDVRHKDAYADLAENVKEFDRVLARYVLGLFAEERAEVTRLKHAMAKNDAEICQTLAQAIGGYPWYKDDQNNFPGATEADGVCVGDHVAASLASEAATCIQQERAKRGELLARAQCVAEGVGTGTFGNKRAAAAIGEMDRSASQAFDAMQQREQKLREALTKLTNEVRGMIGTAEPEIREVIGNTNFACLKQRTVEAVTALAESAQETTK